MFNMDQKQCFDFISHLSIGTKIVFVNPNLQDIFFIIDISWDEFEWLTCP